MGTRKHERPNQTVSPRRFVGLPEAEDTLRSHGGTETSAAWGHPLLRLLVTHLETLCSQNFPKMCEALFQSICTCARRISPPPAPRLEHRVLRHRGRLGGPECIQRVTM